MTEAEIDAVRERLIAYRQFPVEFARDVFGVELDEWQERTLRLLGSNQKVAIAGCTGCGKDFIAAISIFWFLCCHEYPKIICTAVKQDTLRDNLWAECNKVARMSPLMGELFTFGADKIAAKGAEEEWFAVARTTSKRNSAGGGGAQAEGLAGKYADDVLNIVDEASGVDDANFDALEGSCNTPRRKMLVIGNPLRQTGRMAQIWLDENYIDEWKRVNVSYLDSIRTGGTPEVRAIREKWIQQYGVNSAYVQARVFGQFPTSASEDTIFGREEVQEAMKRFEEKEVAPDKMSPLCVGVDCARFGLDETVFYVRQGMASLEMKFTSKTNGPEIVGQAIDIATKWSNRHYPGEDPQKHVEFRVDETGLGGSGVVDPLREQGWQVCGVHNGSRATLEEDYHNLGSELWMEDALDCVRLGCSIVKDDILLRQLETRQYKFTGKARCRRLWTKDEMRRAGLKSPDRADAFVLAFADSDKLNIGLANLSQSISFI